MPRSLHITVLDCDTPVPNVYAERGLYSDIFATLLRDAASKTPELSGVELRFSKYDSVRGEEPSAEELSNIDAIVITGSAASAYDKAPWVGGVALLCKKIYASYPSIRLFGSCFGHQILCHALFSQPGENVVSKDTNGWELGVHPVELSPEFLSHFGTVGSNPADPTQARFQFVHADHVVVPQLPEGLHSIGRSKHCALQGVWKKGRLLTYQGHAEFDSFINGETLKVFGEPIWNEGFLNESLQAVDQDDDATWAATVMLKFFLETPLASAEIEGREEAQQPLSSRTGIDGGILARLYHRCLEMVQHRPW
ncbi:class I glutamine amidotransferase-like protein [Amylocarpus encephaloides]|uniref:Class I glutamine amidotransferase-like protein n=1 Tax=Amylocarpus encephaloides TaxID=45428 RepID=A0A9P7YS89_9HELO|nr:class I glutamine amidotransferase-like protein [Amylocarpus encephaloides]